MMIEGSLDIRCRTLWELVRKLVRKRVRKVPWKASEPMAPKSRGSAAFCSLSQKRLGFLA